MSKLLDQLMLQVEADGDSAYGRIGQYLYGLISGYFEAYDVDCHIYDWLIEISPPRASPTAYVHVILHPEIVHAELERLYG